MATLSVWVEAARPRTLPASLAPVVVGTAAGARVGDGIHLSGGRFALVVVVALAVQIAVNYANDYFDGVRGVDTVQRAGPRRAVASGLVSPRGMRIGIAVAMAVAAAAGIALAALVSWWLLLIGAAAFVALLGYSGGPRPYASAGLGELFVFVFFGLVATLGTTWVQALALPQEAWFGAIGAGLLACAVLLANNLRDIDQDRVAGKKTLTVLIGRTATRWLFSIFVLAPFAIAAFLALFYPIAWLSLLALLAGLPAILIVWTYRLPRELVVALGLTSLTSVAYGAFLMWAFIG